MQSHKIDYLQYSTDEVQHTYGSHPRIERSPNKFYKYALIYESGVMVLSGNPNSNKELCILSGKCCDVFRSDLKDIVTHELEHGAKFSRVDLCVTIDGKQALDNFKLALSKREIVSKRLDILASKTISDIDDKPETIYVGNLKKRGRKGIFRAYNKGIELGLGFDLSRFELECKGAIANNNIKRWVKGTSIGNMIRAGVDLPKHQWWIDIMGEETTLPQVIDDAINKMDINDHDRRWLWLMKQVAPALGKHIAEAEHIGDETAMSLFLHEVEKHYKRNI